MGWHLAKEATRRIITRIEQAQNGIVSTSSETFSRDETLTESQQEVLRFTRKCFRKCFNAKLAASDEKYFLDKKVTYCIYCRGDKDCRHCYGTRIDRGDMTYPLIKEAMTKSKNQRKRRNHQS